MTWPSLDGDVIPIPIPTSLGFLGMRLPHGSGGLLLLFFQAKSLEYCSGWNCRLGDFGFFCGFPVGCVFQELKWWIFRGVWLLPPSQGAQKRAESSICSKVTPKKTPSRGVFTLPLLSREVKLFQVLSAAAGFGNFNVCQRFCALVSGKKLVGYSWESALDSPPGSEASAFPGFSFFPSVWKNEMFSCLEISRAVWMGCR